MHAAIKHCNAKKQQLSSFLWFQLQNTKMTKLEWLIYMWPPRNWTKWWSYIYRLIMKALFFLLEQTKGFCSNQSSLSWGYHVQKLIYWPDSNISISRRQKKKKENNRYLLTTVVLSMLTSLYHCNWCICVCVCLHPTKTLFLCVTLPVSSTYSEAFFCFNCWQYYCCLAPG